MRKESRPKSKNWIYLGVIVLLGIITLLFLPIWQIKEFDIVGTQYYSKEEILQKASLQVPMHILSFNKKKAIENIETLNYINAVQINYKFPYKAQIEIKENQPVGYIKFHDDLLCIDSEGKVLEQVKQKRFELPIIEGLKFKQFKIGESLEEGNKGKIQALNEIIEVLMKYDFVGEVDSIDISNIEQIHLYVDKLDVIIGNMKKIDDKIKWLIKVNHNYTMGILDLSHVQSGQAVLTPLD